MVTRAVWQLSFNPLDPPLMGEEEREDLRDTLKLPVRLRRTLSFVIPAEPVLVETGSGNPVLGIAVNPLVDCRIGGTPLPRRVYDQTLGKG